MECLAWFTYNMFLPAELKLKKLGQHDQYCHASLLPLWHSLLICSLVCKSDYSYPINDKGFGTMQFFILLVCDCVLFW